MNEDGDIYDEFQRLVIYLLFDFPLPLFLSWQILTNCYPYPFVQQILSAEMSALFQLLWRTKIIEIILYTKEGE